MTGWLIAGGILLFLVLLLFIPVCVNVAFEEDFTVSVSYLFLKFGILPKKEKKKKKPEKKKKKPDKQPTEPKKKPTLSQKLKKLQSTAESVLELVGAVKGPVKYLFKTIRLYRLELRLIVASDDPCDTAENYGKICAAAYPLLSALRAIKKPRKQNVVIKPDFCESEGSVTVRIKLGIIPWAAIISVVGIGINYLAIIFKKQTNSKQISVSDKNRRKKQ